MPSYKEIIYFRVNCTGAKLYSRPSSLTTTGANVPVAPVESAPMAKSNDMRKAAKLKREQVTAVQQQLDAKQLELQQMS